jgi:hypothetical protein
VSDIKADNAVSDIKTDNAVSDISRITQCQTARRITQCQTARRITQCQTPADNMLSDIKTPRFNAYKALVLYIVPSIDVLAKACGVNEA